MRISRLKFTKFKEYLNGKPEADILKINMIFWTGNLQMQYV